MSNASTRTPFPLRADFSLLKDTYALRQSPNKDLAQGSLASSSSESPNQGLPHLILPHPDSLSAPVHFQTTDSKAPEDVKNLNFPPPPSSLLHGSTSTSTIPRKTSNPSLNSLLHVNSSTTILPFGTLRPNTSSNVLSSIFASTNFTNSQPLLGFPAPGAITPSPSYTNVAALSMQSTAAKPPAEPPTVSSSILFNRFAAPITPAQSQPHSAPLASSPLSSSLAPLPTPPAALKLPNDGMKLPTDALNPPMHPSSLAVPTAVTAPMSATPSTAGTASGPTSLADVAALVRAATATITVSTSTSTPAAHATPVGTGAHAGPGVGNDTSIGLNGVGETSSVAGDTMTTPPQAGVPCAVDVHATPIPTSSTRASTSSTSSSLTPAATIALVLSPSPSSSTSTSTSLSTPSASSASLPAPASSSGHLTNTSTASQPSLAPSTSSLSTTASSTAQSARPMRKTTSAFALQRIDANTYSSTSSSATATTAGTPSTASATQTTPATHATLFTFPRAPSHMLPGLLASPSTSNLVTLASTSISPNAAPTISTSTSTTANLSAHTNANAAATSPAHPPLPTALTSTLSIHPAAPAPLQPSPTHLRTAFAGSPGFTPTAQPTLPFSLSAHPLSAHSRPGLGALSALPRNTSLTDLTSTHAQPTHAGNFPSGNLPSGNANLPNPLGFGSSEDVRLRSVGSDTSLGMLARLAVPKTHTQSYNGFPSSINTPSSGNATGLNGMGTGAGMGTLGHSFSGNNLSHLLNNSNSSLNASAIAGNNSSNNSGTSVGTGAGTGSLSNTLNSLNSAFTSSLNTSLNNSSLNASLHTSLPHVTSSTNIASGLSSTLIGLNTSIINPSSNSSGNASSANGSGGLSYNLSSNLLGSAGGSGVGNGLGGINGLSGLGSVSAGLNTLGGLSYPAQHNSHHPHAHTNQHQQQHMAYNHSQGILSHTGALHLTHNPHQAHHNNNYAHAYPNTHTFNSAMPLHNTLGGPPFNPYPVGSLSPRSSESEFSRTHLGPDSSPDNAGKRVRKRKDADVYASILPVTITSPEDVHNAPKRRGRPPGSGTAGKRGRRSEDAKSKRSRKQTPVCPVCNKVFRDKYYLDRHLVTHTGEKAHECAACGLKFTQEGHLTRHIKTIHASSYQAQCHMCSSLFQHPRILNERYVDCPKCSTVLQSHNALLMYNNTQLAASAGAPDISGRIGGDGSGLSASLSQQSSTPSHHSPAVSVAAPARTGMGARKGAGMGAEEEEDEYEDYEDSTALSP